MTNPWGQLNIVASLTYKGIPRKGIEPTEIPQGSADHIERSGSRKEEELLCTEEENLDDLDLEFLGCKANNET